MNKKKRILLIITVFFLIVIVAGGIVFVIGKETGRRSLSLIDRVQHGLVSLFSPDKANDREEGEKALSQEPAETVDRIYMYKDEQGVNHFSVEKPQGLDYQILYFPVPGETTSQKPAGRELAEKVKMTIKGGKALADAEKKRRMNTDRPRRSPVTPAEDTLNKANALRQEMEKRYKKQESEANQP